MYNSDKIRCRDNKKTQVFLVISAPKYSCKLVGYEEDNEAVLVISSKNSQLESVIKIPMEQMEALLFILNQ